MNFIIDLRRVYFKKYYLWKKSSELLDCLNKLLKWDKRIKGIFTSKGKEISLICLKKIKNSMDYPNDEYIIINLYTKI